MNIVNKVIINTTFQIAGRLLSFILSFISIFILTRYLDVSGYGNFVLIFSYLSFFGFLSDMGLSLIIVREFSKKISNPAKQMEAFILIKIILTLLSILLALLTLIFFPYSDQIKLAIVIGSFAVAIGGLNGFGASIFQSRLKMDLVTLIDQITKIITVVFIGIFVILKLNFYFIVSSVLLGNSVGFIITLFYLHKEINIFQGIKLRNFSLNKKLLKDSLLMGVVTLLAFSYFKVDSLILSIYKNSEELGIYSLAYKIIENILLFWGFYMASIFPLFSLYSKNNFKKYINIFNNSLTLSIIYSASCLIIGYNQTVFIVNLFGGSEFMQSIIPLRILLLAVPLFLINNIFYHSFLSLYKIKPVIVSLFISLIFNVLLNIIFIPHYGYIAASYITVVTELILLILYSFFIRRDNVNKNLS